MPEPKKDLIDAYKEIITTIIKQSKDQNYVLNIKLPA